LANAEWPVRYTLRHWQSEFVEAYLQQRHPRSLLVTSPGTGKPITALFAAKRMLEEKISSALIVINDSNNLRDQWKHIAGECGFKLSDSIDLYRKTEHDGLSITVQTLRKEQKLQELLNLGAMSNWFGIVDEGHTRNEGIHAVVNTLLDANEKNRFLFIASALPLATDSFDAQFQFNTEYVYQDSIVRRPETKIEIARFAPSFSILSKFVGKPLNIDELSWREFEKLISELLVKDGYDVKLMQGTKDGGVDVVAVKDMGKAGLFKTLWQAKKKVLGNKVGLSVVRELADTTRELKASKGIIVTSTYLTGGALARIQRDKYILGKVDRDDLNQWIDRVLFERSTSRIQLP
jgi:HJR/Mrr/RecB family endonuclease